MKKLSINFKIFTFKFSDCLCILNRNIGISIFYYTILIFLLSLIYHFKVAYYMSFYSSFVDFFKNFLIEFYFSTIFYIALISCIYSFFNFKINSNNKSFRITFKHLVNLFSHLYTIPFLLDILFLIIFKDKTISANSQSTYVLLSIIISLLINIIYPILFIKYVYKKNIKILPDNVENKHQSVFFKKIQNAIKVILVDYNYLISKISSMKIINLLFSFLICCFLLSFVSLFLNPNTIYLNSTSFFGNINVNKIFLSFFNLLQMVFIGLSVITISYTLFLKFKNIKSSLLINFKLIISSSYLSLYMYFVYLVERKINTLSVVKPSLLPTQMVIILIPVVFFTFSIFLILIYLRNLLYMYYKEYK